MVLIYTFLCFTMSIGILHDEKSIISEKLNNQAICWNEGDIDCFMNDYWKNDSLMYIGKNGVTYGWQNTLDNYKKRYPTKNDMGKLSFEIVRLEKLDKHHYFQPDYLK